MNDFEIIDAGYKDGQWGLAGKKRLILAAYFLFKLSMRAFLISLPYLSITLVSTLLSWNMWDLYIAEMVVRKRAYQGLPVREEMIKWFQAIAPEAFLIVYSVIVITLIILFHNFKKFTKTIK